MKSMRRMMAGLIITLIMSMSVAGCYGNFVLYHKIYKWNGSQGDKWQKSVIHAVMWVLPVYGGCLFIDLVALNTIEFWTGKNPLAMNENEKQEQIVHQGNETYRITASQNRWDVSLESDKDAGMTRSLVYNESVNAWFIEAKDFRKRVISHDSDNPMDIVVHVPDGRDEYWNLDELVL